MKIFAAEADIRDKILARNRIKVPAELSLTSKDYGEKLVASVLALESEGDIDSEVSKSVAKIVKNPHPFMLYGSAILVSTAWNYNDDVFLPEHLWEARKTPINTPFNSLHESEDIIGHIIGSRVLNQNGEEVSEDIVEIPTYLDIEVDWVVYASIYPETADELKSKALKGKVFVSMECTAFDFDYAVMKDDKVSIIERTEDTAFLTKHLVAFDGTGEYNGYRIGRIVKKIVFDGMGKVYRPANKNSRFTALENYDYQKVAASELFKEQTVFCNIITKKGLEMAKIENVEQAIEIVDQLQAENSASEKERGELSAKLEAAEGKLGVAEKAVEDIKAELEKVQAELEETKNTLTEKTEILNKIEAEKRLANRVEAMQKAGIKYEAEKDADRISAMSEDVFTQIIEYSQRVKASDTKTQERDETKEEKPADLEASVEDETDPNKIGDSEDINKVAQKLAAALVSRNRRRSEKKTEKK